MKKELKPFVKKHGEGTITEQLIMFINEIEKNGGSAESVIIGLTYEDDYALFPRPPHMMNSATCGDYEIKRI